MVPAGKAPVDPSPIDSRLAGSRKRIRETAVQLVAERGYGRAELGELLERLAIEREDFERSYPNLAACYAEAWIELSDKGGRRVRAAFAAQSEWHEALRAAAWACCRYIQEDLARARFLVELGSYDEAVRATRDVAMAGFAELIDLGGVDRQGPRPPLSIAEGIVGAIWERISKLVRNDELDSVPVAIPEMMYVAVLPYLGPEAAQEELRRGPGDIARYLHDN